jgi:hypothetical protein
MEDFLTGMSNAWIWVNNWSNGAIKSSLITEFRRTLIAAIRTDRILQYYYKLSSFTGRAF